MALAKFWLPMLLLTHEPQSLGVMLDIICNVAPVVEGSATVHDGAEVQNSGLFSTTLYYYILLLLQ